MGSPRRSRDSYSFMDRIESSLTSKGTNQVFWFIMCLLQTRLCILASPSFSSLSPTSPDFLMIHKSAMEVSEEEREATFKKCWAEGGIHVTTSNFGDILLSEPSNTAM